MEQSNLLVDTITQKLLNDVSEWPDHLRGAKIHIANGGKLSYHTDRLFSEDLY